MLGAVAAAVGAAWLVSVLRTGESNAAPLFVDRAKEAGLGFKMSFLPGEQGERFKINFYDHGAGVAVADVDGDGDDDVYFCNQLGPNALYLNDGRGRFTDVTKRAGVGVDDRISVCATFADVDGDGDQDLYVTTTRGGNVFFRNRGDGTFEDATEAAGLTLVAHSEVGTFFDADGDGDLDLLVTCTARWTTDSMDEAAKYYVGPRSFFDLVRSPRETNRFYKNRGNGTFKEASVESGLLGPGWTGDVAVFDMDDDGDLDVFVANMFGRSLLYENDGHGTFHDVGPTALGKTSWGAAGCRAFDYDGDGRLDVLVVDMHSDMWMETSYLPTAAESAKKFVSVFGPMVERGLRRKQDEADFAQTFDADPRKVLFGNTLFRNLGGGRFEETSDRARVETLWPWGIAAGDFDGDGWTDAFLPSGMGWPYAWVRSPLLMNGRDGTFTDRAAEAGLDPPPGGTLQAEKIGGHDATRSSRCAATADFDGDGRLDVVVNNFNGPPYLLMNRWPKKHFVGFRLRGTTSSRDAVGAVVRLRVGGLTLVRQVESSTGYLAQSSHTLHFGLGDATTIDSCEIRWPRGIVQTLKEVKIDAVQDVVEPAK